MNVARLLPFVVIVLAAALFLAGCARFESNAPADKGAKISEQHVLVFPLFGTSREVYTKGIEDDGCVLLLINWSTWKERPARIERRPVPAAPDAGAPPGGSGEVKRRE